MKTIVTKISKFFDRLSQMSNFFDKGHCKKLRTQLPTLEGCFIFVPRLPQVRHLPFFTLLKDFKLNFTGETVAIYFNLLPRMRYSSFLRSLYSECGQSPPFVFHLSHARHARPGKSAESMGQSVDQENKSADLEKKPVLIDSVLSYT